MVAENPDGGGEKFSVRPAAVACGNDESHGERRWVCEEHFSPRKPAALPSGRDLITIKTRYKS